MKIPESLQTVNAAAESVYQERSSRFIALVRPCSDDATARQFRDALKKEHHKAVHVVLAYRIGHTQAVEYSTDDGEPTGSEGKPVLNELRSRMLSNTAVCVVRYYGGKKLGIPGLIQAYRQAASQALELAGSQELVHRMRIRVHVPASEQHLVANLISGSTARIEDAVYAETTTFIVSLEHKDETVLQKLESHWQLAVERIADTDN